MKRAVIIFIILFLATVLIPVTAVFRNNETNDNSELVTLFSQSE